MTHPQQHRRLLNILAVCEKLSMSRSTFNRRRPDLEAAGFPKPTMEADQFGSTRWDEKAIDIWLDGRMDPKLGVHQTPRLHGQDVAETLRARALAL